MRCRARASVVLGSAIAALCIAAAAFAHAEPQRVSPGAGAVVTTPPAEVVIEMTQEVVRGPGTGIDVVDEAGEEVTTVDAVVENGNRRRVSVLLPAALEPGLYTVRWKTVSAEDGDSDEGEYSFTFDPSGTADPGREVLKESVLTPQETPAGAATPVILAGGDGGGTSWILVAAVGVGMLVLGSGVTFLLVQKSG